MRNHRRGLRRIVLITAPAIGLFALTLGAGDEPPAPEAAIRGLVQAYLATAAWPDPAPIVPELYADDIEAYWSNGETLNGRDAVVEAMKAGVKELADNFDKFAVKAENMKIRRDGDMAWVTCLLVSEGKLTKDSGAFNRQTRSTFIFEKRDGHWRMVHEHSSRVRVNQS